MPVNLLLDFFAVLTNAPKSKFLKIPPFVESVIHHKLATVEEMKGKILFCQMSDYLLRQIEVWIWLLLENMPCSS